MGSSASRNTGDTVQAYNEAEKALKELLEMEEKFGAEYLQRFEPASSGPEEKIPHIAVFMKYLYNDKGQTVFMAGMQTKNFEYPHDAKVLAKYESPFQGCIIRANTFFSGDAYMLLYARDAQGPEALFVSPHTAMVKMFDVNEVLVQRRTTVKWAYISLEKGQTTEATPSMEGKEFFILEDLTMTKSRCPDVLYVASSKGSRIHLKH